MGSVILNLSLRTKTPQKNSRQHGDNFCFTVGYEFNEWGKMAMQGEGHLLTMLGATV